MTSVQFIKRLVVGVVLAATFVFLTWVAVRTWQLERYYHEQSSGHELLVQLKRDRRPENLDSKVWEEAVGWAITAHANVCFSESHVPIDELRRFRADLEKRLDGEVDLATVDWIWQRLAETGPHGRQYREKFEPQYRDHVNYALTNR